MRIWKSDCPTWWASGAARRIASVPSGHERECASIGEFLADRPCERRSLERSAGQIGRTLPRHVKSPFVDKRRDPPRWIMRIVEEKKTPEKIKKEEISAYCSYRDCITL